ncbi:MAG: hypothetical protein JWR10_306 [Rubritepida sp.]|nr:hypothetical protein [Rubritepida sp.]
MGDLVNLRKWRRAKQKAEAETQAAANRTAFGRTKAETQREKIEQAHREGALDAAKLDEEPKPRD